MTSDFQAQVAEKSSFHLSRCTLYTPPLVEHLKNWACNQCNIQSKFRWKITSNSRHHKTGCARRDMSPTLLANVQWGKTLN
jgi:hypothetical protein